MVFGSPKQRSTTGGVDARAGDAEFHRRLSLGDAARGIAGREDPCGGAAVEPGRSDPLAGRGVRHRGRDRAARRGVRQCSTCADEIDETEPHAVLGEPGISTNPPRACERVGRAALRDRGLEFKPVFETLRRRNYAGWISLEAFDFTPGAELLANRVAAPPGIGNRQTAIMSHYVVRRRSGVYRLRDCKKTVARRRAEGIVIDSLLTGHEHNLDEVRGQVDFQRTDIATMKRSRRSSAGPRSCFTRLQFRRCRGR